MHDETQIDDWKAEVSRTTGVPAEVLRGADLEDIQAHAETLKPLLHEPSPAAGYVPSEGRTVAKATPSPGLDFKAFLDRQLGYTR